MLTPQEDAEHRKRLAEALEIVAKSVRALGGSFETSQSPHPDRITVQVTYTVPKEVPVEFNDDVWRQRNKQDIDIFTAIILHGLTTVQAANRCKVKYNEPPKVIARVMYAIHQELKKDKYADVHYKPGPDGTYDTHIYALRHHKYLLVEVLNQMDQKHLNEILTGFYKQKK